MILNANIDLMILNYKLNYAFGKYLNIISLNYQGLIKVRFGELINSRLIGGSLIWFVSTAKTEDLCSKARFTYEESPKIE